MNCTRLSNLSFIKIRDSICISLKYDIIYIGVTSPYINIS